MAELFTVSARINLDQSGYTEGLRDAEGKGKELAGKLSGWSNAVSVAVGNMISGAVSKVGSFLKNAVTSSIQTGAQFDSSMAQVAATMGKTVDQVQDLARFARQMGASTSFSASEAADALNYMALAGYDAQTSMKMLPNVLNLAAAGGIALASASDMVTDAASALGLTIDETATMVDQIAVASSKTNTSVAQLGEAILAIGGTAQMISGGTNELATSLGILADNGIKGAEGGTHLRNIILALVSPTDTAAEALNKLGVQVTDSSGEMRAMKDVFSDLGKAMENMSSSEKAQLISTIFNKTDIAAVNALLGTNYERWEEIEAALNDASGAAKKMANTQLDNLNGDLKIFGSALDEAKISIAEGVTPSLRSMVQYGTDVVTRLTKAYGIAGFRGLWIQLKAEIRNAYNMLKTGLKESDSAPLQFIGSVLEGIETAFGWISEHGDIVISVIAGIGAAFAAIKIQEFIGSLGSIKTAVSALVSGFNPWLLVIAAVAAGAALIIQNWDAVKAWFIQAGDTIVNAWNNVVSFLSQPFSMEFEIPDWNTVVNSIHDWWSGSVWPAIQNFFKTTFGVELPDWDKIVSDISNWWDGVWGSIKDFFKTTFGIDLPDWSQIVETIGSWWGMVWDGIGTLFSAVFSILTGDADSAWKKIENWWTNDVWTYIQNLFKTVFGIDLPDWNTVKSDIENGWNNTVWPAIKDFFKNTFGIELPDWSKLATDISTGWGAFKDNVAGWFVTAFTVTIPNFFTDVYQKISSGWTSLKDTVANWFKTPFVVSLPNFVVDVFQKISNGWNTLKETVANWFKVSFKIEMPKWITDVWDKIKGGWDGIKSWVSDKLHSPFKVDDENWGTAGGQTGVAGMISSGWSTLTSWVGSLLHGKITVDDEEWGSPENHVGVAGFFAKGWSSLTSWVNGLLHGKVTVDDENWGSVDGKDGVAGNIATGWEGIKDEVNNVLHSFFTLDLPDFSEIAASIKGWWEDVKKSVGNLFITSQIVTVHTSESGMEHGGGGHSFGETSTTTTTWNGSRPKNVTGTGSGAYVRTGLFDVSNWGSNAKGLDFVPYNDYLTRLHFGEAILTRTEAQDWRESGGSKQEDSSMVLGAINALTDALKNLVLEADGQAIGRLAARYGASEIGGAIATMNRQTRTGYGV